MLSITEMAILGVGALLLFGPEQLPGMMKKAGRVIRDVQNTSQSFIREMERAGDDYEAPKYEPPRYEAPQPHTTPSTTEADAPAFPPQAQEYSFERDAADLFPPEPSEAAGADTAHATQADEPPPLTRQADVLPHSAPARELPPQ